MGFRPPGAPSKNPATACKAEKKKRGKGARTLRDGNVPAGNLFDDDGACLQHEACIAREVRKGKRRSRHAVAIKNPTGRTQRGLDVSAISKPQISACDDTIRETRP